MYTARPHADVSAVSQRLHLSYVLSAEGAHISILITAAFNRELCTMAGLGGRALCAMCLALAAASAHAFAPAGTAVVTRPGARASACDTRTAQRRRRRCGALQLAVSSPEAAAVSEEQAEQQQQQQGWDGLEQALSLGQGLEVKRVLDDLKQSGELRYVRCSCDTQVLTA
jgi:cysteine sulfinate desulfinase/cysteine desulfurase-like protein